MLNCYVEDCEYLSKNEERKCGIGYGPSIIRSKDGKKAICEQYLSSN